ncbi:hypothetical protein BDR07DRAFT_1493834 [Suillus spraguei]|nr:hypothetical protein BDR07DRAFT_1493834 [Suillus spraguei]
MSRCRADEDTIIGHLKAQVYKLMSLGIIEGTFEEDSIAIKGNVHRASAPLSESLDISKHGIKWIKDELHRQIDVLSGKLTSNKIFPWKTLPLELTCMSIIIKGYLEDVLLPGGFHTTINKGIAKLTLKETGIIVTALKVGTMSIKKVSEAKQAEVLTSECPVVEGAPPAANSVHTAGHCLFVNGKSDCLGALCLKQSAATKGQTLKKASALPPSATSLVDESNDEPNMAAPVRPQPPPSQEFKVVKHPMGQKKVDKEVTPSTTSLVNESDDESNVAPPVHPQPPPSQEFKVAKCLMGQKKVDKEVISLGSSDTPSGSDDLDDYQDDVSSKKQKAKSEGTSRASKKRVSPSVAPVEMAVPAKKMKGKVLARPKGKVSERRAPSETAESSGDEHIQDVMPNLPNVSVMVHQPKSILL